MNDKITRVPIHMRFDATVYRRLEIQRRILELPDVASLVERIVLERIAAGERPNPTTGRKRRQAVTPEHIKAGRKLVASGKSLREASRDMGLAPGALQNHRAKFADLLPPPRETRPRVRVTRTMLAEATRLREAGYSWQEAADRVGCSKGALEYHLAPGRGR